MDSDPYSAPSTAAYLHHRPAESGAASPAAIEKLSATRPWVIFIAVMLFIGSGFMLLATASMLAVGSISSIRSSTTPNVLGSGMLYAFSAVYLVLALVNIFFGVKLCLYAGAISRLTHDGSENHLVLALDRQRSFWKMAGITTIVIIATYVVLIAGMVVTSVMRMG